MFGVSEVYKSSLLIFIAYHRDQREVGKVIERSLAVREFIVSVNAYADIKKDQPKNEACMHDGFSRQ